MKLKLETTLDGLHSKTISCVDWSYDGEKLAVASFDATISIYQRQEHDFECVHELEGHKNEVKSVCWAETGGFLLSCSRDRSVWVWCMEKGDDEFYCNGLLSQHMGDVKTVKWVPKA